MNADMDPIPVAFRRIVQVPFGMCLVTLDSLQRTAQDGELRFGKSLLSGPIEHDPEWGTSRIEVRLAWRPLRPPLRMRLEMDRWSFSSTAFELIPCGRVWPTAAYFRAGDLLLDSLTSSLLQHVAAAHDHKPRQAPAVAQSQLSSSPLGAARPSGTRAAAVSLIRSVLGRRATTSS